MHSSTAVSMEGRSASTPEGLAVSATGDLNPPLAPLRERLSWALYDFANKVFWMNIATLYFSAWTIVDLGHWNTI